MDARGPVTVPDICPRLRQVLGHRGAAIVGITVERDEPLGKARVAESFGIQEAVQDLPEPPGFAQGLKALALPFQSRLQLGMEGKALDAGHELPQRRVFRQIPEVLHGRAFIRGPAPGRQQWLKHPGGRSRRRDELREPAGPSRLVAAPAQPLQLGVVQDRDAVARGAGTVQDHVRQARRKRRQIPRGPLRRDAAVP